MATTTSITPKGDYGRRYAIISGYDERIRAWSRKQYLTFEAAQDNTQVLFVAETGATTRTIEVSTDNGLTWSSKTSSNEGTVLATLDRGEKVLVKRTGNSAMYASKRNAFSASGPVYCYGNLASLFYGDNFINNTSTPDAAALLKEAFLGFTNLRTSAKKGYIIAPFASLPNYAFQSTFRGCTGMTMGVVMDATVGGVYTLNAMYRDCSNLRQDWDMPITTFNGAYTCSEMYYNSGLVKAPRIKEATFAKGNGHFNSFCRACASLVEVPLIAIPTLSDNCFVNAFQNSSLLSKVTCLATDISATNCLNNWLGGVAATGTFIKAASMTSWPSSTSGIPTGWTVQDYVA